MIHIELVIVLVVATTSSVQPISETCGNSTQKVEDAFRNAGIFADLNLSPPSDGMGFIRVTYGKKQVSCGTLLSVTDAFLPPTISYVAESSNKYTVIRLEVDFPTRTSPVGRSYIHWMILNVQGSDMRSGNVASFYEPPGYLSIAEPHRYAFLVFNQSNGDIKPGIENGIRAKFNVYQYAHDHGLNSPVAGNYFFIETVSMNPAKVTI
ncbi:protein D2-like [Panonychus citri]|uniref:protein D2-like n=1 Tax=Panonychus citri TaxID=50023 RepID=UPI002307FA9C|nr:protein D2-like [Panonychus citri]